MIRRPVIVRAIIALTALMLMAMSCETYYDLRVDGENGRVVVDAAGAPAQEHDLPYETRFLAGATAELTPEPDAGYRFVRWQGDASGSSVPLSVDMVDHQDIVAVFEPGPVISLSVSPSGLSFSGDTNENLATQSFTVSNNGNTSATVSVTDTQSWLSASPTSFSLAAGSSRSITVDAGTCPSSQTSGSGSVTVSGSASGASSDSASVSVSRSCGVAVANDAFADAEPLTGATGTRSGSNEGASKETGEPDHAGRAGGASVWWRYAPSDDGTLTVDTNGSSFDTVLAVYTGAGVSALREVDSDDNGGLGRASEVSAAVSAGTTYWIAVDGYASGDEGAITLNWTFEADATPVPDDATIAIDVTPDAASWVVRENDASGSTTAAGNGDEDVAVSAGTYIVSASLSGYAGASQTVTVGAGETRDVPLTLEELATPRTLTIDASGGLGTVLVDGASETLPFTGDFEEGTSVEIEAVPASGYTFTEWTGDLTTSANPTTVDMSADRSVTVEFEAVTVEYDLTVDVVGSGSGTVTSSPSGIACGTDCTASFDDGTPVTLTATPDAGSTFAGWSGACSGTASCEVGMDSDREVSATFLDPTSNLATLSIDVEPFDADWTVREGGSGGVVVDSGVGDATLQVDSGTYFLSASRSNYVGASSSVTVAAGDVETVLLELVALPFELTVTVTGAGSGSVTSTPVGINCSGGTCSAEFDAGEPVSLTATPSGSDEFDGWSGACSGTGTCTVTMDQARSVTATFVLPDVPPEPEATLRIDVTPLDASWTVRNNSASGSIVETGSGDATVLVAPGTYYVSASRSLYAEGSDTVTLVDGDDETVFLALTREYELTVQGSNGAVLVDGTREALPYSGTFLDGTPVGLEADPDPGYTFQGWTGTTTGTSNPLTVTLDRTYNLTASFVDASSPSITISGPTSSSSYDTSNSSVTLSGSAGDAQSGIDEVEYRVGSGSWNACSGTTSWSCGPITTSFAGATITVRATNGAGLTGTDVITVTREDTSAPSVGITSPTSSSSYDTSNSSVTLSGSAGDAQSGIDEVEYRVGSGSWNACSGTTSWSCGPITTSFAGATITVRATNGAGLTGTDVITVTREDTSAPSVGITSPTSSSSYETPNSSVALRGNASDSQSGIDEVEYRIGSGSYNTCTGTTSWNCGNVPIDYGTTTVTVRATNGAGLSSTDTIVIARLPEGPSVVRNYSVTAPYRWRSDADTACAAIKDSLNVLGFDSSGPTVGSADLNRTWRWGCIEWEQSSSIADEYVIYRRAQGSSLVVDIGGFIGGSSRLHTDSTHQGSTPWYYGVASVVDGAESDITWAAYPTAPASDYLDLVVSVPLVRDLEDPDTTSSGLGSTTTTIRWTFDDPWSTASGIASSYSLAHYYEAQYNSFTGEIASASRTVQPNVSSRDTRDFARTTDTDNVNFYHWRTSVTSFALRNAGSLNEIAGIAVSEVMRFTVDENLTDAQFGPRETPPGIYGF